MIVLLMSESESAHGDQARELAQEVVAVPDRREFERTSDWHDPINASSTHSLGKRDHLVGRESEIRQRLILTLQQRYQLVERVQPQMRKRPGAKPATRQVNGRGEPHE